MLNEDALRRALAAAGLDAPVRWDDVTDSTNRTALELARAGAPAWTLVAAGHQTAGRGRAGRTWVDRPGGAVMLSVVLRPPLAPEQLGLVSLAAGAAMAAAASELSGVDVRCTWPNDLVLAGAKIGGILAESEVEGSVVRHVVLGVGVNLESPEGVPGAGAIGRVDEEALVSSFLRALRALIEGPADGVVAAWRAVGASLGRPVEAITVGGAAVRGLAADLDDTGALLVDTAEGRARVAFGEIVHLGVNEC